MGRGASAAADHPLLPLMMNCVTLGKWRGPSPWPHGRQGRGVCVLLLQRRCRRGRGDACVAHFPHTVLETRATRASPLRIFWQPKRTLFVCYLGHFEGITMKRTTAFLTAIAFLAAASAVYGLYDFANEGLWP